jgi:membrane protein
MGTTDDHWRYQAGRGRFAERPRKIPLKGWKDVLLRVKREVAADRIGLVAGGVAYYAILALFPMLVAAISLYGLFTTPAALESQVESMSTMLPEEARAIITGQLRSLVSSPSTGLTLGAIFGLLVALFSATKGTDALISSVGLAYEEEESRGYIKLKSLSFALTLGLLVGALLAFALVAIVPAVMNVLGLGSMGRTIAELIRWPLLVLLFMAGLGIIYRYAPDRRPPQWRWVSPGSVIATVLWVIASFGFSFYVARFGNYEATYGSIAAVIVLLLWLFISAYVILLGAEINAEIEHQTSRDSTIGPDRPMGSRGAQVADTVGAASLGKRERKTRPEAGGRPDRPDRPETPPHRSGR